jgi:glycosyltransferase involved in cell wall biosynthesis
MKTSLIVPAYNEERGLPLVIEDYLERVDEIIVVDDGSTDGTSEAAERYLGEKVKLYKHNKNKGKVRALRTGVDHASYEIIIFTDADYTYPARYVPDLVKQIEAGADLVLGSRLLNPGNIRYLNRAGNYIFSFLRIPIYLHCRGQFQRLALSFVLVTSNFLELPSFFGHSSIASARSK